jgi:D-alanyl-D-alanine carboxypeptidase (penicillin-binding protein 5/6)
MTMTLILDALSSGKLHWDDKITASKYACSMGGTQVWLEEGEQRSVREMLTAISVASANDCSVAVAEHIAGSEEAFVGMMNAKAKELGMTNTNFSNSHGLPIPNHYVSAKDMAILARYALRYPELLAFTSIKQYTFRPEPKLLILYNTNKLLWWYPGSDGLKTGQTVEAKRNLVGTAKRDNLRLISVVLGVGTPKGHFSETIKLFNMGFSDFGFTKIYDLRQPICEVDINKGKTNKITLVAARDVGALHQKGKIIKPQTTINIQEKITAPIAKGQKLGEIIVAIDGQETERVDLLAATAAPKAGFWFNFKNIISQACYLGALK